MVDKAFVRRTVMQGRTSIHIAQIALDRSSSDAVKKIANLVIHDRMRLNEAFTSLAKNMGVELPDEAGKNQTETVSKLEKLNGADFDNAYLKLVLDSQKDMDEAFGREANYAANPDLKAIATRAAPVLHKHRENVEKVAQGELASNK
jgi:putative membrane protein